MRFGSRIRTDGSVDAEPMLLTAETEGSGPTGASWGDLVEQALQERATPAVTPDPVAEMPAEAPVSLPLNWGDLVERPHDVIDIPRPQSVLAPEVVIAEVIPPVSAPAQAAIPSDSGLSGEPEPLPEAPAIQRPAVQKYLQPPKGEARISYREARSAMQKLLDSKPEAAGILEVGLYRKGTEIVASQDPVFSDEASHLGFVLFYFCPYEGRRVVSASLHLQWQSAEAEMLACRKALRGIHGISMNHVTETPYRSQSFQVSRELEGRPTPPQVRAFLRAQRANVRTLEQAQALFDRVKAASWAQEEIDDWARIFGPEVPFEYFDIDGRRFVYSLKSVGGDLVGYNYSVVALDDDVRHWNLNLAPASVPAVEAEITQPEPDRIVTDELPLDGPTEPASFHDDATESLPGDSAPTIVPDEQPVQRQPRVIRPAKPRARRALIHPAPPVPQAPSPYESLTSQLGEQVRNARARGNATLTVGLYRGQNGFFTAPIGDAEAGRNGVSIGGLYLFVRDADRIAVSKFALYREEVSRDGEGAKIEEAVGRLPGLTQPVYADYMREKTPMRSEIAVPSTRRAAMPIRAIPRDQDVTVSSNDSLPLRIRSKTPELPKEEIDWLMGGPLPSYQLTRKQGGFLGLFQKEVAMPLPYQVSRPQEISNDKIWRKHGKVWYFSVTRNEKRSAVSIGKRDFTPEPGYVEESHLEIEKMGSSYALRVLSPNSASIRRAGEEGFELIQENTIAGKGDTIRLPNGIEFELYYPS